MMGGDTMQVGTKGMVAIVIGTIAAGFVAGYTGSRLPDNIKEEKKPKTVAAIVEEPEYVHMEKLESTVEEQVVMKFKPYQQKLDSWETDKGAISTKLNQHGRKLKGLEEADEYFHGIVEEETKRLELVEENITQNRVEIEAVRKELGPGDKFEVQMVYANPQFEPKFSLSAYDNKLYIDDIFGVVEEWQKDGVNRVAIVDRPSGKGKAVFFSGADNRFNVEFVQLSEGIDKITVLSDIDSISGIYTMSKTEASPVLKQFFEEYGSASLVPFKQAFKKPAVSLLFGEKPEIGKYQGKYYFR
jgi:hypothetical protein